MQSDPLLRWSCQHAAQVQYNIVAMQKLAQARDEVEAKVIDLIRQKNLVLRRHHFATAQSFKKVANAFILGI